MRVRRQPDSKSDLGISSHKGWSRWPGKVLARWLGIAREWSFYEDTLVVLCTHVSPAWMCDASSSLHLYGVLGCKMYHRMQLKLFSSKHMPSKSFHIAIVTRFALKRRPRRPKQLFAKCNCNLTKCSREMQSLHILWQEIIRVWYRVHHYLSSKVKESANITLLFSELFHEMFCYVGIPKTIFNELWILLSWRNCRVFCGKGNVNVMPKFLPVISEVTLFIFFSEKVWAQ